MAQEHARSAIFDTVRIWLGRGLSQSEVQRIDEALDELSSDPTKPAVLSSNNPVPCVPSCRISPAGMALIKRFEGCARLRRDGLIEAYPDPATGADPWTIGWGATGPGFDRVGRIGPGTVWTQDQCDQRLEQDLVRYASDVSDAIGHATTTQGQFDAMVSFHYNTGAIARATLTKRHRAGDFSGAAAEFQRWNRAGGRILRGLTRRRAAESEMYLG